ncbi:hypothetical protein W911_04470 [Hyphomicrobium nitrativorans NL23]|uniref:O-antigen ligase-related domain-containing protein n=1 Tax=Hyphomicrobium nitrativorans NL23 TaxID=1029756 RepID=V5SIN7_9HYPH|nr:O-antigen ligase family protein [Hyphomicrobium nitrativorans]AHB49940.1 hypothetical protein W911_04470 [Hyphomicrobium nitrativorans NL23]
MRLPADFLARDMQRPMKYVALFIGLVGIVPLTLFLRGNPAARNHFWLLLGVIPFIIKVVPLFDLALITWHDFWFGFVPGLQVSAIDLIAIALYFTVRHQTNSIRYHFPFLLYLTAISLSVFQADEPLAAVFYLWQCLRIYFFTIVIAKACTDEAVPMQLLKGLAIGIAIQFFVVIYQKFGLKLIQPTGTFIHQNTLGLIMHLVVMPHFALLLRGQRQILSALTPMWGLTVAALIASRAALGFAVMGVLATYFLSSLRRWSTRKALVGLGGVLIAAVLVPVAISSLEKRFDAAPLMEDEYDERAAFNRTALSMLAAKPFGVGANHYAYAGKKYGYSIRAGVVPFEGNLNNIVHNAYYLNAAEAGYLGLVAFTILMLYPIWIALRYSWMARGDPRGDLLLGLGMGLATVAAHSLLEYVVVVQEVQYVLAMVVGMIFGVAHQIRISRSEGARAPRSGVLRGPVGGQAIR